MGMLSDIRAHVTRLIHQPRSELGRWQRAIVFIAEMATHCWRKLEQDRAMEMAAALTYRTIFALVPLFVLGLVVFRAFGGFEDAQTLQNRLLSFLGVSALSYESQVEPGDVVPVRVPHAEVAAQEEEARQQKKDAGVPLTAAEQAEQHQKQREVSAGIQTVLNSVTAKVSNLSFTSLGIVGILLFIYAGVGLVVSLEYDMNIIFQAPVARPWHLRIPIHWSIITLGTALLSASLYLSSRFIHWVEAFGVWTELLTVLSRGVALLASWVMLLLLFKLMPNTKVQMKAALIGSLVAAVMWEVGKISFQFYVQQALPYSALYGSLGLIPLFLFWVYLSWAIALFGLELTYAIQVTGGSFQRPREPEPPRLPGDPNLLIPILAQIAQEFVKGKTIGRMELADRVGLPSRVLNDYLAQLQVAGLIHCVGSEGDRTGYSLARPPDRIAVAEVLALGAKLTHTSSNGKAVGWDYLERLAEAQRKVAHGATLATLVAEK
ncbi:MAG: YhjD/YihY/BrkB family envelope integrity protein [Phycisphaeraceae bacterium]